MAVKVSGTTVIDGSRNVVNIGTVDGRDVSVDGTKLDGVQAGAEVNQNAFTTVSVAGQSDVVADAKTDTLNVAAGSGITITTDAGTDTLTFAHTDTSTQANVTNTGTVVIQSMTFDTFGHVTGVTSTSLPAGYSNTDVDNHLNTGTATTGQVLSWSGSDYDWIQAGAINDVFYENSTTVSTSYTLTAGKNAVSAGPITIADGVTVTVPAGSRWAIV